MLAKKQEAQSEYSAGFANLFSSPVDAFSLNLCNASLVEVLRQHEQGITQAIRNHHISHRNTYRDNLGHEEPQRVCHPKSIWS